MQSPERQMTERQKSIFDFIVAFRRNHGCSPSIPEIQQSFGIRSPNGVVGHLHALEQKGFIRRDPTRGSRQIEIPNELSIEHAAVHALPIFGQIPAGMPQEFQASHAEGTAALDETTLGFHPKPGSFMLKVRGESMKDAGILSGDMVVIEPTPTPRPGQIVAALIDGESTLKRLVRIKGRWFLKAENTEYPELHPRSDLVIQGVVRTVVRQLD